MFSQSLRLEIGKNEQTQNIGKKATNYRLSDSTTGKSFAPGCDPIRGPTLETVISALISNRGSFLGLIYTRLECRPNVFRMRHQHAFASSSAVAAQDGNQGSAITPVDGSGSSSGTVIGDHDPSADGIFDAKKPCAEDAKQSKPVCNQPAGKQSKTGPQALEAYTRLVPPSEQVLHSKDILPLILYSLKESYGELGPWKNALASMIRVNKPFFLAGIALLWETMVGIGPLLKLLPWHGESAYQGLGKHRYLGGRPDWGRFFQYSVHVHHIKLGTQVGGVILPQHLITELVYHRSKPMPLFPRLHSITIGAENISTSLPLLELLSSNSLLSLEISACPSSTETYEGGIDERVRAIFPVVNVCAPNLKSLRYKGPAGGGLFHGLWLLKSVTDLDLEWVDQIDGSDLICLGYLPQLRKLHLATGKPTLAIPPAALHTPQSSQSWKYLRVFKVTGVDALHSIINSLPGVHHHVEDLHLVLTRVDKPTFVQRALGFYLRCNPNLESIRMQILPIAEQPAALPYYAGLSFPGLSDFEIEEHAKASFSFPLTVLKTVSFEGVPENLWRFMSSTLQNTIGGPIKERPVSTPTDANQPAEHPSRSLGRKPRHIGLDATTESKQNPRDSYGSAKTVLGQRELEAEMTSARLVWTTGDRMARDEARMGQGKRNDELQGSYGTDETRRRETSYEARMERGRRNDELQGSYGTGREPGDETTSNESRMEREGRNDAMGEKRTASKGFFRVLSNAKQLPRPGATPLADAPSNPATAFPGPSFLANVIWLECPRLEFLEFPLNEVKVMKEDLSRLAENVKGSALENINPNGHPLRELVVNTCTLGEESRGRTFDPDRKVELVGFLEQLFPSLTSGGLRGTPNALWEDMGTWLQTYRKLKEMAAKGDEASIWLTASTCPQRAASARLDLTLHFHKHWAKMDPTSPQSAPATSATTDDQVITTASEGASVNDSDGHGADGEAAGSPEVQLSPKRDESSGQPDVLPEQQLKQIQTVERYARLVPPNEQVLNSKDIVPLILASLKASFGESERWKGAFASMIRVNRSFFHAGCALLWDTMTSFGPTLKLLPWYGEGGYKGLGVSDHFRVPLFV
ncbi:hypothetical protein NMY22_g11243 [Coprinellus aureogranulatus]|nr:hypothetical protein NMY22_g11243 [Coprinellus aureogranulatus]